MFFFFLSLLIFPILNTLICMKGQILNSAVDFSVRKHLWCVCLLNGALPASAVASGSLSHMSDHNYQAVGYFISSMWFERRNYELSSPQTFHISRFTWRNPSMGCHGWIHNWRSIYGSGHACSAACTFPAPKAKKRFWTTDECELQPQKVHGRGLVPLLCFFAYSCRRWPTLPNWELSWEFITHSLGSCLHCSHLGFPVILWIVLYEWSVSGYVRARPETGQPFLITKHYLERVTLMSHSL